MPLITDTTEQSLHRIAQAHRAEASCASALEAHIADMMRAERDDSPAFRYLDGEAHRYRTHAVAARRRALAAERTLAERTP